MVQREGTGGQRPTFLTLRDHGKVYVADLPRLSDGQLTHINKEAQDVLDSLNRRLQELEAQSFLSEADQDTRIRATTKRDITQRFLNSIAQEQELRRSNPALRAAAGESLARAFLELARHRLPGSTFDSLLQEALSAAADITSKLHQQEIGNEQFLLALPLAFSAYDLAGSVADLGTVAAFVIGLAWATWAVDRQTKRAAHRPTGPNWDAHVGSAARNRVWLSVDLLGREQVAQNTVQARLHGCAVAECLQQF